MTGPTTEWYREQCEYNRWFYEWLHKVRPRDAHDWKVNALFYSELHRVNYWFAKETGRAPRNHFGRNRRVEDELPRAHKDYKKLYLMSMRARYRDGHRLKDNRREEAVKIADRIAERLPFQ